MIRSAAMKTLANQQRRLLRLGRNFIADRRALAAVEFAFIVPLALVLFFGAVEFSTGLAVSRKVTLTASTLSDVTSEQPASGNIAPIADTDLQNIFTASISILNPYSPTPLNAQLTEVYVSSTKAATVQWSKAATVASGATQATLATSSRNVGDTVTLPTALQIPQTYILMSEVSYLYTPTIGYVMAPTGVTMSDIAYSLPRQANCIVYNGTFPTPVSGACPTP
jgi:Flp pilus assembly protein TadG